MFLWVTDVIWELAETFHKNHRALMWMEAANPVYGRTCNPYHTSRTAGGSSGGEGALIGAAGTPFGIGSDVGGSIR